MFGLILHPLATPGSCRRLSWGRLYCFGLALLVVGLGLPGLGVAAAENANGLPIPRFVTTHFDNINVRVGPGTKYDVSWIYTTAGTPVEVIQEFDVWRKIRDYDGKEGWIQETQLTGNRTGLVAPGATGTFPLYAEASAAARPRAFLPAGFRVTLRHCDGDWCQVSAKGVDASGRTGTYSGYLHQQDIWGALKGEKF